MCEKHCLFGRLKIGDSSKKQVYSGKVKAVGERGDKMKGKLPLCSCLPATVSPQRKPKTEGLCV